MLAGNLRKSPESGKVHDNKQVNRLCVAPQRSQIIEIKRVNHLKAHANEHQKIMKI